MVTFQIYYSFFYVKRIINNTVSRSSSASASNSQSSSSSFMPKKVLSAPIQQAFALAAAKSVTVKTKAAKLPPSVKNGHSVPLATALETAAAPYSVKI